MEPLEIYDSINNKVLRVFVTTEVAEKCRNDTEFAQDLFNRLQEQDVEEGCAVEIESIKTEEHEVSESMDCSESLTEEKTEKEVWTRHETLKLLKVYQKYKDTFKEHKQSRVVWAMIAAELSQYNVFKSAAKCAEKWKNLMRTYRVANEKPHSPTRFQYYHEVKDILNGTINMPTSDNEADEGTELKYTPTSTSDAIEIITDNHSEDIPEKESWSRYETLKFLKVFQAFKHMKQNFSKEKHFWSIISAQLAKEDIQKHHEKCAAKWKNLLRSYRKNLEKPNVPTRFHYFQEVSDVLNDIELDIPNQIMRITDDVEKIVDPKDFKSILEEVEVENSKESVVWTADETLKLIQSYKQNKDKFRQYMSKKLVWAIISSELAKQGIYRDPEKVENKWKSLLRSYRKGEIKGGESSRFYFYKQMCDVLDDEKGPKVKNDQSGNEYLEEENSMDQTEVIMPNNDHSYSENTPYERIVIQTELEDEDSENHWSYNETSALLVAYVQCKKKFKDPSKGKLWERVSRELETINMFKSAQCCEKKWKKLLNIYKTHKLNKTGPVRFQFYQEIDDIVKNESKNEVDDIDESTNPSIKCKCSEKRLLDKQNRHRERMQMLKRKLDIEERKVAAFEYYVKHLKQNSNDSDTANNNT